MNRISFSNDGNAEETIGQAGSLDFRNNDTSNRSESLDGLSLKLEGLSAKFNDMKRSIENEKISYVQILGIFTAIFTFISINFQIIKSSNDIYQIVIVNLFLLGSLLFLMLCSKSLFMSINAMELIAYIVILIILFGLGVFFTLRADKTFFRVGEVVACFSNEGVEEVRGPVDSVYSNTIKVKTLDNNSKSFYFGQCKRAK